MKPWTSLTGSLAAAIAHGISYFVTFNKDHFKRFSAITALLPSEV
jgi:hypothetical protein